MLEDEIYALNKKKSDFNLNENFEQDLDSLNTVKYNINKSSSLLSKLKIRKELIEETKKELESNTSTIDLKQLEILYSQATLNISGIQKTFEELVSYHNKMLIEKARFVTSDLPILAGEIQNEEKK